VAGRAASRTNIHLFNHNKAFHFSLFTALSVASDFVRVPLHPAPSAIVRGVLTSCVLPSKGPKTHCSRTVGTPLPLNRLNPRQEGTLRASHLLPATAGAPFCPRHPPPPCIKPPSSSLQPLLFFLSLSHTHTLSSSHHHIHLEQSFSLGEPHLSPLCTQL
jgi:hypothetical protein